MITYGFIGSISSGIFFDIYGEYYEDMREVHQHLPALLKLKGSTHSLMDFVEVIPFFSCCLLLVSFIRTSEFGLFYTIDTLPNMDCLGEEVWNGVKHIYWLLDTYYLPVCQTIQDSE